MYLIVLGAGPVGGRLIEMALKDGHDVAVIEADEQTAKRASEKFDALVLHANIGQGDILEEAGASKAEVLVATTGDDSANLMAMFLGAELGIRTLISVVNEGSHRSLFERLGVHVLLDPEIIVARHLYGLVTEPEVEQLFSVPGGAHAFRVTTGSESPLVGKTLADAKKEGLLPDGVLLVAVSRGDDLIIPSGKTSLAEQDVITFFSQEPLDASQVKGLTG